MRLTLPRALVLLCAVPTFADTYATLAPSGTPPSQRMADSCVKDAGPNRMVMFGGGQIDLSTGTLSFTNDLFSLSLGSGTEAWTQMNVSGPPSARGAHTAVYDAAGDRMILFGGLEQGAPLPTLKNDVWALSLSAGSEAWTQLSPNLPALALPRFAHSAVYLEASRQMVVFGGYTGTFPTFVATPDMLVLDFNLGTDGTWAVLPIGGAPSSAGHQIVYDSSNNRILLFGVGDLVNSTFTNDVWARDLPLGTNSWTQLAPAPPLPSARQGFGEVYDITTDPSLPRWLILGGGSINLTTGATDYPGDAYVFEATPGNGAWVALVPSNNTARSGLWKAVHDVTASRVVLFGGANGYGFSSDTTALSLASNYDPTLASATPASGVGGQSMTVTLRGSGTSWANGTSFANFGPEVRVNSTSVSGPDTAIVSITIMSSAIGGPRNVGVITGGQTDSAIGLFTVNNAPRNIIAGQGLGAPNPNEVRVFLADGTQSTTDFQAYSAGAFGVNVAGGEIDGDGLDEILTAPGPGAVFGPQVRAFEETGTAKAKVNFYAYGTLKYGCNVGDGDTDRDGFDEIVTGAGPGDVFGPHTRGWNFDNTAVSPIAKINFFAYSTLKFGVKAVTGDVEFDGYDEILTAPGPGQVFGSQIRGFNVDGGTATAIGKINFVAFNGTTYGANVASGDTDGDGYGEILAGKGPSSAYNSQVLGFNFDGAGVTPIAGLDVLPFPTASYGARVGAGTVVIAPGDEILTAPGPDPAAVSDCQEYGYNDVAQTATPLTTFSAFATQMYGTNVVAGNLGF